MNDALNAVREWNAGNPPGTPVAHRFADGREFDEVTDGDAFRMGDVPSVFLRSKKNPVALKSLRRREIAAAPTIAGIHDAVRAALPAIPDGFDLAVKLTLVDSTGPEPRAFVQSINA